MSSEVREKFAVISQHGGSYYHYILPAFFHLIHWLCSNAIPHAILIRSYGRDIKYILEAVHSYLADEHPTIRPPNSTPDVYRQAQRFYTLKLSDVPPHIRYMTEEQCCTTDHVEIYESWSKLEGIIGIQDDFEHWLSHNYHHTAAKPFWIERIKGDSLHIIFDDNIRFDTEDGSNVVNFMWRGASCKTGVQLTDALTREGVNYVQTDLLEAIKNPRYFIEAVEGCVKRFEVLPPTA